MSGVNQDATVWMNDPLLKWINKDDCGNFPCTANLNIVIRVEGATNNGGGWNGWSGMFSILSPQIDLQGFETRVGDTLPGCQYQSSWNDAYYCDNKDNYGILLFNSEDDDALYRAI